MAGRKHLIAVNRAIRRATLDETGLDAPIVELVRDLARRMDSSGADGPPLNLMRSYLSATKDLSRAAARKPVSKPVETVSSVPVSGNAPALHVVEERPIDKLRKKKASGA